MEFINVLLDNIETPINITFNTPSQILSNSIEKDFCKNGEHDDSHTCKIKNILKINTIKYL